MIVYFKINII